MIRSDPRIASSASGRSKPCVSEITPMVKTEAVIIGIGGRVTPSPLPHHQDMRVRIRRFDRLVPYRNRNEWAGRSHAGTPVESSLLGLASVAASARCAHPSPSRWICECHPSSRTRVLLAFPIVRAFVAPATITPSADFCRTFATPFGASSHSRQPRQISRDKLERLPRATAGFTTRVLDGYGLRYHLPARPTP